MIMGDHGRVGTHSRFLTSPSCLLVVLIEFQVTSSSLNAGSYFGAPTPTPAQSRPARRAVTPIALTAVAVSTNQINLTWTNNSDNVAGLYVERALSARGP